MIFLSRRNESFLKKNLHKTPIQIENELKSSAYTSRYIRHSIGKFISVPFQKFVLLNINFVIEGLFILIRVPMF